MFKTLNNINQSYIKNIFNSNGNAKVCPNDIVVRYHKTTSYDDKNLNIFSPKTWNQLPSNINRKHP